MSSRDKSGYSGGDHMDAYGADSGSEYSSEEVSKRKREENPEIEQGLFKTSKKTYRSPAKSLSQQSKSGNMEEIKEMLKGMMEEIKEMRKENREYKEEIRVIKLENEEMKEEMENLKQRIMQLELIEQKVERIEKDKIKNNLIISGLKLKEQNNEKATIEVQQFLKLHLKIDAKIVKVGKIKEGLYIVELASFEKKIEILKIKGKIDALKRSKIYINSDLTKEERKIQKMIRDRAKTEKDKGNRVKIGFQYLICNEVKWKWNQITKRMDQVNSVEESTHTPKN